MNLLKIDLHKIIRSRFGKVGKYMPGFIITGLEKLIHQKELNEVLEETYPKEGSEFAQALYDHFKITLLVKGEENIPSNGRFLFASNHPLGGMDGIGLIKVLGGKYGDDNIRFLVNDLLMNVEPLRPVFLPVNKFGGQGRGAAMAIAEAYESDKQMLIFPAGLCSRLHDDGKVADLQWQKSFLQRSVSSKRDIIPVRFEGLNRPRFYRTARWRKKVGLKVNIEQALLPAELCAAAGKTFTVIFGAPIKWQEIEKKLVDGETVQGMVSYVRNASERLSEAL